MDRFHFQRHCVGLSTGTVLNVGSKEDPAYLKAIYGERVLNCDITTWDTDYNATLNIDVQMDCRKTWPFEDDSCGMVVFGDILEHLYADEALFALMEAERIAEQLCITVPGMADQHRRQGGAELWELPEGNRGHCIDWTEHNLRAAVNAAGWDIKEFNSIDYQIVPVGYLVYAVRSDGKQQNTEEQG